MPVFKPPRLRREVAAILVVKLVLIVSIKLAFFSDAEKPGSAGTASALLAPASISPSSQQGVPHD